MNVPGWEKYSPSTDRAQSLMGKVTSTAAEVGSPSRAGENLILHFHMTEGLNNTGLQPDPSATGEKGTDRLQTDSSSISSLPGT